MKRKSPSMKRKSSSMKKKSSSMKKKSQMQQSVTNFIKKPTKFIKKPTNLIKKPKKKKTYEQEGIDAAKSWIEQDSTQNNTQPEFKYILKNIINPIHVYDILFTQETISHSFSGNDGYFSKHNIESNIDKIKNNKKKNLNIDQIAYILNIPEELLILNVIIDTNNNIYSCNNRRLCMLKKLNNIGFFDGFVFCKNVSCKHKIKCNNNNNCTKIIIQKPNQPGITCESIKN